MREGLGDEAAPPSHASSEGGDTEVETAFMLRISSERGKGCYCCYCRVSRKGRWW